MAMKPIKLYKGWAVNIEVLIEDHFYNAPISHSAYTIKG